MKRQLLTRWSIIMLLTILFAYELMPYVALASAVNETPNAETASETETETETELMPELLPTDTVSTTDFLLYSGACVVMDIDSGNILYSKNKWEQKYPASTTKILTTLLAIERGSLTDELTFSDTAIQSITWDSSNMDLEIGNKLTLEETLYGVMLASANEAANGVAEYVSGSMEAFAADMTEYARSLGCRRTNFTNASGLPDDNHYTTAKDLATIAAAAAKNETFCQIAGTASYIIENVNYKIKKTETTETNEGQETEAPVSTDPEAEPVTLYNHHKMINKTYPYDSCFGGKTGYTEKARNTLVTYARRGNMNLVCVVLDCPGGKNYIYKDTEVALDYCFANYESLMAQSAAEVKQSQSPLIITTNWNTISTRSNPNETTPFTATCYTIYAALQKNQRDSSQLVETMQQKASGLTEFAEYSKLNHYRLIIIAGGLIIVGTIALFFLVRRLIRIGKRIRSRRRYEQMRRKRLDD